jgi:hypothetical protein
MWHGVQAGRRGSLQNLLFERDTFRVVFGKPTVRGVRVDEQLEMINVADFLAGIDVNPNCCHRITAEGQDGHSLAVAILVAT